MGGHGGNHPTQHDVALSTAGCNVWTLHGQLTMLFECTGAVKPRDKEVRTGP